MCSVSQQGPCSVQNRVDTPCSRWSNSESQEQFRRPSPPTAANVRAIWRSPSDDSQCAEATRPAKKTTHVPRRLDPRTMVPTQVLRLAEVWSSAGMAALRRTIRRRRPSVAVRVGRGQSNEGQKARFAVSRGTVIRRTCARCLTGKGRAGSSYVGLDS